MMHSQHDLSALRAELRQVEARIRADFQERNLVWLDLARKALLLIAQMILEASQPRERRAPGSSVPESEQPSTRTQGGGS